MIINKDIKSFGFIKKKETIKSWNNIPNCKCRIFSVINPFPDYLCKSSEDNNCKPYFFLLSIKHTHETNNEQIIKTKPFNKNELIDFLWPGHLLYPSPFVIVHLRESI